jgi:uncharacterized coiled-coil protein SlyX
MYVYYRVDPVYENKIILENKEFDFPNKTKVKLENYLYLFKEQTFKDKIMSITYLPDNFNFENQVDVVKNEKTIIISLVGSNDLKNRLVLSAITKNFKDEVKKELLVENQKLLISLKEDKENLENKYNKTLEQKNKYIKFNKYNILTEKTFRLEKKLEHNINYAEILKKELLKNKKKLSELSFNRNDYSNYKQEQQSILMNKYFYQKILQKTENKIKNNKIALKNLNKKIAEMEVELARFDEKIEILLLALKNKNKSINNFELKIKEKQYQIKTLNFYDAKVIDNKPKKALILVFLFSLIIVFPFWKFNLS